MEKIHLDDLTGKVIIHACIQHCPSIGNYSGRCLFITFGDDTHLSVYTQHDHTIVYTNNKVYPLNPPDVNIP